MATTIKASFSELKQNLEITSLQSSTVSTRQKNVRDVIRNELAVLDDFLTGSYMRSTMICPLNQADVDIFFVLDASYFKQDGQAKLLDTVKAALKKEYKTPDISRNGQAVTIQFSDFKVDVVPGFYREGGGYLIANSRTGTWIPTDPKKHVTLMSTANAAHNYDLVPLVKMLKAWNRNISFGFTSFHLEVLAMQILDGVKISDFSSGVRYYFDKGRAEVKKKNPDPAGYSNDVGAYINTDEKLATAVSNFTTAYNRAIKAESFAADGKIEDAVYEWRKIFGSYFPAYG